MTVDTTLGELVNRIYEHFLLEFADDDLASVATAAVVNDLRSSTARRVLDECRSEMAAA